VSSPDKDLGIIAVLLQRLNSERLPFMLELRKKVDSGERLSDGDIHYLHQALTDARDANLQPLIERHPEYRSLVGSLFSLYRQVVDRALANESRVVEAGR